MQYTLFNSLLEKEETLSLLSEPMHIREERETIERTLAILKKASNILKRDTDISKCYNIFFNYFSLIMSFIFEHPPDELVVIRLVYIFFLKAQAFC